MTNVPSKLCACREMSTHKKLIAHKKHLPFPPHLCSFSRLVPTDTPGRMTRCFWHNFWHWLMRWHLGLGRRGPGQLFLWNMLSGRVPAEDRPVAVLVGFMRVRVDDHATR